MTDIGNLKVSARGQLSLPSKARHRWGLDAGGTVAHIDLGDVVLILPGGVENARRHLLESVPAARWREARGGFGDSDLADQ